MGKKNGPSRLPAEEHVKNILEEFARVALGEVVRKKKKETIEERDKRLQQEYNFEWNEDEPELVDEINLECPETDKGAPTRMFFSRMECVFTLFPEKEVLSWINERRKNRNYQRNSDEDVIGRGRPTKDEALLISKKRKRSSYNRHNSEFTSTQLRLFLAIFLIMSLSPQPEIGHYFCQPSSNAFYGNMLISSLMSYYTWIELYQCISIQEDEMIALLNQKFQEMWIPGQITCLDESMCAHQGRKCPHHIFVPRKPHPHGMQFYSLADNLCYVFAIKLKKRTEKEHLDSPLQRGKKPAFVRGPAPPRQSTTNLVCEMVDTLPSDTRHKVVMDSYFGGFETMQMLWIWKRFSHVLQG
eukprot:Pompholyxophrys_sp_v1_NODE_83_length_2221_cov_2.980157.p1 type:complete len:356 gc:universal NODE_83_length_2221_cov_2.980157:111-1178(+)